MRIDRSACLVAGEPDVFGPQLGDAVSAECTCLHAVRTFGRNLPWPGLVDGFAIDLHPRRHAVEYGDLLTVDGAVGPAGDVEDKGAVLAYRIDHPVDYVARRQVAAVIARCLIQAAIVVPIPDASLRLPGIGHDPRRKSTLIIGHQRLGQ